MLRYKMSNSASSIFIELARCLRLRPPSLDHIYLVIWSKPPSDIHPPKHPPLRSIYLHTTNTNLVEKKVTMIQKPPNVSKKFPVL